VKGVTLKVQSPEDKTLRADEFGRVFIAIPAFKELFAVGDGNPALLLAGHGQPLKSSNVGG
jgi:hypothetical protein